MAKEIFVEESNCLSQEEMKKLEGTYIDDSAYDILMDEDCDVYRPGTGVFDDPIPLLKFRKDVFSKELLDITYENLRPAARNNNNRGIAAGPLLEGTESEIASANFIPDTIIEHQTVFGGTEKEVIVNQHKNIVKHIKRDGSFGITNYSNKVKSGIVGFYDRYPRIPFCRQTSYTEKFPKQFEKGMPMIRAISNQFKLLMPDAWAQQKRMCDKTIQDYVIDGTVYTTVTVNSNFQTAVHVDTGDFRAFGGATGNLVVLENNIPFKGGYLVFPKYRVAVNARAGDVLIMDVHERHSNTKIYGDEGFDRMSLVCYYREKIINCKSVEIENERRRRFQNGHTFEHEIAEHGKLF